MKYIKEIRIKYFRSIYDLSLKKLDDSIIFSGRNDTGKSNILKALNLFFNNQTDWQNSFNFQKDFNFTRLAQVREDSIKGKQFIQISIKFMRGKNFVNTLPKEFTVKKTWDRNSLIPKETDNLERKLSLGKINNQNIKIIRRSLTQFLNKVNFEYVPAIKDQRVFTHLLNVLQREIIRIIIKKGDNINNDITAISNKFSSSVEELRKEFKSSTGIKSELSLPIEATELFQVLNVLTEHPESINNNINLNLRGDGIRLRYIPSLYNFLAQNYKGFYILGFEEPENSMEYSLAHKMAVEFFEHYSKHAQIFITTHSPSFLAHENDTINHFRIYKDNNNTKSSKLKLTNSIFKLDKNDTENQKLSDELGLSILQQEFHKNYIKELDKISNLHSTIEILNEKIADMNKPVLYTEGKTDVSILNTAWNKLYQDKEKPFEILPVETTSIDGGDGGYSAINRKLESVRSRDILQLGLYDRDEDGLKKGFNKLNKNFIKHTNYDFVKVHKNKRSIAILLPEQIGLENFVKYCNLPIEFLFGSDVINTRNADGLGLILNPLQQRIMFHGERIETYTNQEIYFSRIDKNTKNVFANDVVQSLDSDKFDNFKIIFDTIEELLDEFNIE